MSARTVTCPACNGLDALCQWCGGHLLTALQARIVLAEFDRACEAAEERHRNDPTLREREGLTTARQMAAQRLK